MPCVNNGTCVDDDIRSPMPCQNGGTCADGDIQYYPYRCECPPEWTGMNCEIRKRCNEIACSIVAL